MEMEYDAICIFTQHGHTFTFKNVKIVCDNEAFLIFSYVAMSNNKMKVASFPKATICGWSMTPKG
jgi:hypothetical protein